MPITISERLRPFSHTPGTACVLPGSQHIIRVYPALLVVGETKIPLNIQGPVEQFTVQLDLEKGIIKVWGKTPQGFFRYSLAAADDKILLTTEKGTPVIENHALFVTEGKAFLPTMTERLSLGSHKAQDFDQMHRRGDMKEIFPHWLRLGQMVHGEGTLNAAIDTDRRTNLDAFEALFLSGFTGILAPRASDDDHQGYPHAPLHSGSPFTLLTEGAQRIRSLFVRVEKNEIHLLPHLPVPFHCGRFVNIDCESGILSFEWTKKAMRQMTFLPKTSGKITFVLPHGIKQCRIDRKHFIPCPLQLDVVQGTQVFFDRFES